ncbi:hypothetical protein Tco_0355104 [Tanacetum coccineum]
MNGVSLGVRFDGCFMHVPFRYQDGKKLILAICRMAYEEFFEFLKNTLEMYVDHHDMKLSQYLEAADTTIMDGVVAKWRGPPKTRHCNKFLVDELVNWVENEVEYDEESIQTEEDAVKTKQIEIGLTDRVERATQDEAMQGEDNQ